MSEFLFEIPGDGSESEDGNTASVEEGNLITSEEDILKEEVSTDSDGEDVQPSTSGRGRARRGTSGSDRRSRRHSCK